MNNTGASASINNGADLIQVKRRADECGVKFGSEKNRLQLRHESVEALKKGRDSTKSQMYTYKSEEETNHPHQPKSHSLSSMIVIDLSASPSSPSKRIKQLLT